MENDEYFQVVIRYIHQNPLKAGMVDDIKDYKWSSYNEYIDKAKFCEIDFALDMLSKDRSQAKRGTQGDGSIVLFTQRI